MRVFGILTEACEMVKYYVLRPEDLTLIRVKGRSSNRLGFAVQLCRLRHPGQGLGGFGGEHPPEAMIDLSRLFIDQRGWMSDIEVNPLMVLAAGHGVRALDVRTIERKS